MVSAGCLICPEVYTIGLATVPRSHTPFNQEVGGGGELCQSQLCIHVQKDTKMFVGEKGVENICKLYAQHMGPCHKSDWSMRDCDGQLSIGNIVHVAFSNDTTASAFKNVTCSTEIRRNWAELGTEKYPKS